MTAIYHITSRDAALAARESGEYRAESLSSEGFIHFSGLHQVLAVAQRFYAGRHGLVLLVVDPSRLTAELKYETPAHPQAPASPGAARNEAFPNGERLRNNAGDEAVFSAEQSFPHLYGPLNFEAVTASHDFEPDANGRFSLPAALQAQG